MSRYVKTFALITSPHYQYRNRNRGRGREGEKEKLIRTFRDGPRRRLNGNHRDGEWVRQHEEGNGRGEGDGNVVRGGTYLGKWRNGLPHGVGGEFNSDLFQVSMGDMLRGASRWRHHSTIFRQRG